MDDIYLDVSKPEERQCWFFHPEDWHDERDFKFSPEGIRALDSMFAEQIMAADSPVELLRLIDKVNSCERLHPEIKKNLCDNARAKL